MERILNKYKEVMERTNSIEVIDEIDYRILPVDGAPIIAVEHEHGIVMRTDFFEIEDFQPISVHGQMNLEPSDYHDMVQGVVDYHIKKDKRVADITDAHSERNHP